MSNFSSVVALNFNFFQNFEKKKLQKNLQKIKAEFRCVTQKPRVGNKLCVRKVNKVVDDLNAPSSRLFLQLAIVFRVCLVVKIKYKFLCHCSGDSDVPKKTFAMFQYLRDRQNLREFLEFFCDRDRYMSDFRVAFGQQLSMALFPF